MHKPLQRLNIPDDVVSELRQMIVSGELPAGARINEVHLARELGVSRTPLREALNRLATEGAFTSVPRIGYFVLPLSLEEFRQLYSIRPLLDPEALRLAGLPSPERLKRLEDINRQITASADADTVIELDDQWHLELIGACPNRILIEMIKQIIRRTRRYETALMREQKNVQVATKTHDRIISALKQKNLNLAIDLLRRNMQTGSEPIIEWLKSRETGQTGKPR
ncbi:MAG TPA: GntR family transcriptional regulator [Gemmatimonadales bacterium]|nr:GntR family transcriptional regulator [Gemmatimonadales bacterium]